MDEHKRLITSALLGRAAHADVFELGGPPRFLFVLFGGSGVDEEEYASRSRSVVPFLAPALHSCETRGTPVVVHVCAPFDVPFARFAAHPREIDTWNAHVLTELLAPWPALPYFVSGFSGGAALALSGLHDHPRCFGGAALGADALPRRFVCPPHWKGKLQLYCAPDDAVCAAPANRQTADALVHRGQAEEIWLTRGRHRLEDYAAGCLGELIRYADGLGPEPE